MTGAEDSAVVKACCAAAYGLDFVALLLGDSYHPGGRTLTRQLADAMDLRAGDRVLDVAAGIGTTALLLAGERDVDVVGVDLGPVQVDGAQRRAGQLGLGGRVRFEVGDAEGLPFPDGSFSGVVCECALCTFPAKDAAAAEFARVLAPGGRVGITDVWLEPNRLDPDLRGLAGRVACLADARPIAEVLGFVERAGLVVTRLERHDDALLRTIEQVESRLRALRIVNLPAWRGVDFDRGIDLARQAAAVVTRGDAGYLLLVAHSAAGAGNASSSTNIGTASATKKPGRDLGLCPAMHSGSSLCFHSDPLEGGTNRRLPLPSHQIPPQAARDPEVGAELARVVEPGGARVVVQRETLHDVGDGTAQEPEVDRLRRSEPDGLHGRGDQPRPDSGSVGGEHHVAAPLENGDLVGYGAGRPS
jgi:SAM-dependent methyltransferase